jgi:hypothetical protein
MSSVAIPYPNRIHIRGILAHSFSPHGARNAPRRRALTHSVGDEAVRHGRRGARGGPRLELQEVRRAPAHRQAR